MTITQFADLVEHCFQINSQIIYEVSEDKKSDLIRDVLQTNGIEAITRRRYTACAGICDIVIYDGITRSRATHWIEAKPIACHPDHKWVYPSPSKFFGEAPFKKDIAHLSTVKGDGEAWFLLTMFLSPEELESDFVTVPNPKRGERLTCPQVVKAISRWAQGEPKEKRIVELIKEEWYCMLYVWVIADCDTSEIPMNGNEFILS